MKNVPAHLHASLLAGFLTFLEFMLAWIPIKIIAAKYQDSSALAATVLNVL